MPKKPSKVTWKQVSVLAPNLWDGYDGDTRIATLRELDGRIWAGFPEDGCFESFKNANFAKLWVEKQYNAR